MKNTAIIVTFLSLIPFASHATSQRIITCKGTSNADHKDYQEFRLNVNYNPQNKSFKANIGQKFTIMNTSHTWNVSVKKLNQRIVIENLNKTTLKVVIDLNKPNEVHNIVGNKGYIQTQFTAAPSYSEPYNVTISKGQMACQIRMD